MAKIIRPIRIEGNIAFIPLSQGYEAVIDASDVPLVSGSNWTAHIQRHPDKSVRSVYAVTCPTVAPNKQRMVKLHRVIMNAPDGMDVDHKDCDGLNNTRANLRFATDAQNQYNQRQHRDSKSPWKGVMKHPRGHRWNARFSVRGKRINVGWFNCPTAAAIAYAKAVREHHGEFARPS